MRKIFFVLFGLPLMFVATVGTVYSTMFFLTFDEVSTEKVHHLIAETERANTEDLNRSRAEAADLTDRLNSTLAAVVAGETMIDSLNMELTFRMLEVSTLKNHLTDLNDQVINVNQQKVSVKELAKTYDTMKPEEFKSILANVDDATVVALYNNMSSRNRKNILIALPNDRAAHITELLAGFVD